MGKPNRLDEREALVWQKFRTLMRELQGVQDRQLARASGLSGAEYALLVPLCETPDGVLRARDLGAGVGWDRSRVSRQVRRMEQRGLVAREPCEDDARGSMVRLTRDGRAAMMAAAPQHADTVRKYFLSPLSRDEMETLGGFLDRMLHALTQE
jgi:DNA-binding MarR family transcriptional regulator